MIIVWPKSKKSGKKRGKGIHWTKVREFEDGRDADWIRNGEYWAYHYKGKCTDGEYIIMRCSKSKQKLSEKRQEEKAKDERQLAKRLRMEEEVENFDPGNDEGVTKFYNKFIKWLYSADT